MRIQHNIMAMNAYRNYTNNTSALAKNLEKLSSGYRINRAGDDAAGLAISEKMRAQITGLDAASKNVKDGISLVKTAEGATQEIHDMLNRMVYLATQSANGTYQDKVDREAITNEFEQLKSEINRIADSANFNGIKLLDGSLDAKAGVTKVEINGVNSKSSGGASAVYGATVANTAVAAGEMKEGDQFKYGVSLNDGTSYEVSFTVEKDDAGAVKNLVSADGTKYSVGTAGQASIVELNNAVVSELQKTKLGEMFTIQAEGTTAGTIATGTIASALVFTAKEPGTNTPAVNGVDIHTKFNAATSWTDTNSNAKICVEGRDAGREIAASDIIEYDGTNLDEALFTINGSKFVVLTDTMDGGTTGTANQEYLRAVNGLGNDVTVLVGGIGGLMKAAAGTAPDGNDSANGNFDQNCKAIADATGLTVGNAVTEATGTNGIDAGAGIRLSAGKGNGKNGLTLQIGDDSEPYNQLKVSIADMHTEALGLDSLTLGTQKGAQDAVTAIKDAINSVSQTRGTLGATQNRLEHTQNNLSVMKENIQDAESTIRDTDVAEEMMAYTKNNILVQSAQAMLAQANQVPQGVLQLLG